MRLKRYWIGIVLIALIAACTTTPVSKKKALILIPFDQEVSLGAQSYKEIVSKEKESTDARLTNMVVNIGRKIAAAAARDIPELEWEFKLIESEQQNAFALPGGKVAVYTGILPVAVNEAGLAAIMGHEVAHVVARHGAQRMSQQILVTGALSAAAVGLSGSSNKNMIMAALGLGTSVGVVLPFSRGNESEADEIGIVYMARAGYDPREAVRFWERFSSSKQGQAPPEFLSTHPSDQTRVNQLTKLLPNALKVYQKASPKLGLGQNF